eukprot:jgi/Chrpa1/4676/Chrysochromulina_OHIO_Genome00001506-RA
MCGARIDEHGPIVVGRDERGGLFGRIIGKAQDHGISLVDGLRACFRILALVFGQRQQLDVLARLEPRANLQARGAGLTLRGTARDGRGVVRCTSARRWRSVHCGSRGRAARTSMKTVAAITADAHLLVEEDTTLLRRPGATARP